MEKVKVAQYGISLDWKKFPVKLPLVQFQIQKLGGDLFCGLSAHTSLVVHFNEQPDPSVDDAIKAYWNGLTEDSMEAKEYVSADTIKARIKELKSGLHTKSWDQMSTAERKLIIGAQPTNAELGLGA